MVNYTEQGDGPGDSDGMHLIDPEPEGYALIILDHEGGEKLSEASGPTIEYCNRVGAHHVITPPTLENVTQWVNYQINTARRLAEAAEEPFTNAEEVSIRSDILLVSDDELTTMPLAAELGIEHLTFDAYLIALREGGLEA